MRVTHVAPTMFGDDGLYGGGERYPLELARALARHVPCRLVGFGSRSSTYRDDDLEVVVLRRIARWRGHPVHPIGTGVRDATARADIVHVHQMRSAPARLCALVGRQRGQKVVVTDHGLGGGGWFGALPRLFDAFAPVSRYSARTLQAPPHKTKVIYGGVDAQRFHPGDDARQGVLFVGRLTPHKGVDRLLRALPPNVPATIVGTTGHDPRRPHSSYPDLLRRLVAHRNVTFADKVADDDLPQLHRTHRVFVLPSVHETCYGTRVDISELLGLSLLEAMSSGTPVICSDVGGLPEVVEDGVTGMVVPPGDVDALRDAIERVCRDDELAGRLGAAARDVVLQRFTWDGCAHRCIELYESVLGGAA